MNQIDLAGGDVIVHELPIRVEKERLARWALVIAEDFHDYRRVLRAKGLVRINVRDARCGLRRCLGNQHRDAH